MGKYRIKYNEGMVTNITTIIEAETMIEALVIFKIMHPNAVYEDVEEVV